MAGVHNRWTPQRIRRDRENGLVRMFLAALLLFCIVAAWSVARIDMPEIHADYLKQMPTVRATGAYRTLHDTE